MVKLNLLLSFICICSLWIFVSGKAIKKDECKDLRDYLISQYGDGEDEDEVITIVTSVDFCTSTDDGKMTNLTLKGLKLQQKTINKLTKYRSLETLELLRIYEFDNNVNFGSLNIKSITFNNVNYGRKVYKLSDKYIQTGILKTLKNVEEISILYSRISQTTLNELSTLTKLKKLALCKCGYDKNLNLSVLNRVKQLIDLTLNIYGEENSFADSINTLCQIRNLKNLFLDSLEIGTIPKCIGNLTKLENLDLDANSLTELPSELSKLTKLKKLRANYNYLKKIPSSFCKLKSLQILMLNNNEITKIPSCIKNIKTLKKLDLGYNQITEIPNFLSELINLEELYLHDNKINGILPESLNNLNKLRKIYVSDNINIKGKSLTNPTLVSCMYTSGNEITNEFCLDKNSKCIPIYDDIPQC